MFFEITNLDHINETDMIFKHQKLSLNILLVLALYTTTSVNLNAQISDVHMDVGYNLEFYTNLDDLDADTPESGYELRGGMNFMPFKNPLLEIGFEAGFSQRRLSQSLGNQKFEFRFNSIDFAPVLSWEFITDLSFETGAGVSFYDVFIYDDDGDRTKVEGFETYDIYMLGGLSYGFHERLNVGARMRYGFVSALTFEPITDYGEIENEKSIINQLNLGFYVRFKFYERDED